MCVNPLAIAGGFFCLPSLELQLHIFAEQLHASYHMNML